MRHSFATTILAAALALSQTGCIKRMLLNGQIHSTRQGSEAANTLGDYEVARAASSAGMVQFEALHRLAPDNEDALFLLLRGWASFGYAFASDDYEVATLKGDEDLAEYHKKRAKLAFDRSIAYGLELVGMRHEGFQAAKKNADTIKAWLKSEFDSEEDAQELFWLGAAWLARVNILKDDGAYVAELFIGVAFLERSREIMPEYMAYTATSTLAQYHARSPSAEMDEAHKMFEDALAKTQRKAQGILVAYSKYACNKADQALYEKLLNEVLNVEDPDPNLRLQNTIAKRRAKRLLSKAAMEDCGFTGSAPVPPAAAAPAKPATPPAPSAAPAK